MIGCLGKCGKIRRGLCLTCYNRCQKRVLAGEITWEELESKGEALPAKRRRQPREIWEFKPWASKVGRR